MDVFEKLGESVYMAGMQVKNKAKEVADIASLKTQISTCDEVIRKNYIAIGKAYYEKYKDDPRFTFLHFEDKGHSDFFIDGNDTYREEFDAEFDKWFETLGYDRKAEENKERFAKDRAEYINTHIDRVRWSNRLDRDLFERFLEFYNDNIDK